MKMKNELATNNPGTCILHINLHAGGAIIRKGNKLSNRHFSQPVFSVNGLYSQEPALFKFLLSCGLFIAVILLESKSIVPQLSKCLKFEAVRGGGGVKLIK